MIFRRRKSEPLPDCLDEAGWFELLHIAQVNTLSLANLTLTIAEDPLCVTDEMRADLTAYVKELEYGVARMEEYIVE